MYDNYDKAKFRFTCIVIQVKLKATIRFPEINNIQD